MRFVRISRIDGGKGDRLVGFYNFGARVGAATENDDGSVTNVRIFGPSLYRERQKGTSAQAVCDKPDARWDTIDYSKSGGHSPHLSAADIESLLSPSPFGTLFPLTLLSQLGVKPTFVGKTSVRAETLDGYQTVFRLSALKTSWPTGLRTLGSDEIRATLWIDRYQRLRRLTSATGPAAERATFSLSLDPYGRTVPREIRPSANETCSVQRP